MESEYYRDVLCDIISVCGDKAWLTMKDIAKYDHADVRTVRARYDIPANESGINRAVLARKICRKGGK